MWLREVGNEMLVLEDEHEIIWVCSAVDGSSDF